MDPLEENYSDYSTFACRVCESKDFLINIFVNEAHQIAEKLCYCASIQIFENDGLPQHICTKCFADLQTAYAFRTRCEETDAKLRAPLNVPVKVEPMQSMITPKVEANDEVFEPLDYLSIEPGMAEEVETVFEMADIINTTDIKSDSSDSETESGISLKQVVKHKTPKIYSCHTCHEKFTIRVEYYKHLKTHGSKRFQCRTCLKWFSRRTVWEKHESVHGGTYKRLPCDKCTKDFSSRGALLRHISEIHDRQKKFDCKLCSRKFAQKTHLQAHEQVHAGTHFRCSKCNAVFKGHQYFMRHEQLHLPPEERDPKLLFVRKYAKVLARKKYPIICVCSYCGKVFNNPASHVIHERVHRGEKPYKCNICEAAFACSKNLSRHKRIHTGERPFKCETCGKCFQEKAHLKTHDLTHTKEKKFVCHVCDKGFSLKGTLKSHMKCHSDVK